VPPDAAVDLRAVDADVDAVRERRPAGVLVRKERREEDRRNGWRDRVCKWVVITSSCRRWWHAELAGTEA